MRTDDGGQTSDRERPGVDEVFAAAVSLAPDARSRYLESCGLEDAALRAELEDLLRCHDEAGDFLEAPPLSALPLAIRPPPVPERIPERIGRFRIERVLGTGGMGRVYLAESEHPRRWVALKVARPGVADETLLRRFQQEAQVVALLQHPGIAQLYEAGTWETADGPQPYFAMEYVDGPTLIEYARRHGLGTRERLELFCRVCDGVEHAHRRGVVHRDLKPANIVVDATGQPKILDFGVARLSDPASAPTTLYTQAGQLIGTLAYMSPEQVAATPGEVDERSDVFSLGVVLFELLTGRLPHRVSSRPLVEAVRAIREEAPTSLGTVDRSFRGDLETIVGRALEKDKGRRYQSAAGLAEDIRRSLRDEPIEARPPSALYQAGKFARRNKVVVAGVAATFLGLSAGLVAAVWQARRAEAARSDAAVRESDARVARSQAEAARKRVEENLHLVTKINDFLEGLFSSPDPDERLGKDVTVMTFLDRSAQHLDEDLADQPHVQATLNRTIGRTYLSLTDYAKAESHLRKAYEIDLKLYGERNAETVKSMTYLVLLLSDQGRRKEALELAKREWGIAQDLFTEDDPERLVIAGNLASAMEDVGGWRDAEPLQRQVLAARVRLLPAGDPQILITKNALGRLLARSGRLQEALRLQREAVAEFRATGRPMDTRAFTVILGLANTLLEAKQGREADELADELLSKGSELYSPDHFAILSARNIKAHSLLDQGRAEEAEAEFRRLIGAYEGNQIPAIDGLARALNNLGDALRAQNRFDEAEEQYRRALRLLDEHDAAPDRVRIAILNNLATSMRLRKDFEGVLPIYKELVDVAERVLAPDDLTIVVSKYGYGVALMGVRQPEESERQLQGAYDIAMRSFTEADEPVITVMRSLVNLYDLWQKPEKAASWRQRLPEKYRKE